MVFLYSILELFFGEWVGIPRHTGQNKKKNYIYEDREEREHGSPSIVRIAIDPLIQNTKPSPSLVMRTGRAGLTRKRVK